MIQTLRALARTRAFRLAAATALVSLGLGIVAELVDELRVDATELAAVVAAAGAAVIRAQQAAPTYPGPEDLTPLHVPERFETSPVTGPVSSYLQQTEPADREE